MTWNRLHIRNNSEGSYLNLTGNSRSIGAILAEHITNSSLTGETHEVLQTPTSENLTLIVRPLLSEDTIQQIATICLSHEPPFTVFVDPEA